MINVLELQQLTVAATALLVGVVYLRSARRQESGSAQRYRVAVVAFVLAGLVAFRVLSPVIAYSLLALASASAFLADLVAEERERRRRVALLSRRPPVDRVPSVWIGIACLTLLTFVPYIVGGVAVFAAVISAACAIIMIVVAWRIASAPLQLAGEDPNAEQRLAAASRARRTGLVCIVAIGSVALFVAFVNATPPAFGGLGRITNLELMLVWAALWVWETWYVRRLCKTARATAS